MDDQQTKTRVAQVEESLNAVEAIADPVARDAAIGALQGILELYGEGLARVMRISNAELRQSFAEDELISHLLMLHDLHPANVESRVQGALEEVRPYLATHGGNVELLKVENGIAHLKLQGSCSGCPSSTLTLKTAIEEAILKAAPDILHIEAEGVTEPEHPDAGFIPLASLSLNGKAATAH